MKPINEMTLEELAEYAVTLDGWDWRLVSGAKAQNGLRLAVWAEGNDDVFVVNRDYENSWKKGQVVGVSTLGAYVDNYYLDEGIDLADPATLGCVLAMTRKKHGPLSRAICSDIYKWGFVSGRFARHYILIDTELQTEAHAMIAALAKEVEP